MRHHHRRHYGMTNALSLDYGRVFPDRTRKARKVTVGRTRNWAIPKTPVLSSDLDTSYALRRRIDPSDTFDILVGSGVPDVRRIPEEFKRVRVVSTLPPIKAPSVPLNTHNLDVLGVGANVVQTADKSLAPAYRIPASVLVCARRKERRSVLFALGRSGRGHKKPRWKQSSYIRC